jgi:hypothetical protein
LRGPPTRPDSSTAAERRALIDECRAEAMADELKAQTGLLDLDTTKRREDVRFARILAEAQRCPTWNFGPVHELNRNSGGSWR